jgi:two-component system phosphate regulon response regulator PhoB
MTLRHFIPPKRRPAMPKVDVILFGEVEGGSSRFVQGQLEVIFHRPSSVADVPLLEGAPCAFIEWLLPKISGLEVCRRMRSDPLTAQLHITMVLEEDEPIARRRALRTGADNYMVGPLSRVALLDRVLSLNLLHPQAATSQTLSVGDLLIDVAAFQASWRGRPLILTPNEFRLLRFMAEHPGRVFSRQQLITALGKQEPGLDERTVDAWICRLRRALNAGGRGGMLRTVRSLGYALDAR